MDSFMSDVKKKSWNKTEETHLLLNTHTVKCNKLLIMYVFVKKKKFRSLFIAFAVQCVPMGTGAVGSVSSQPGSGPTSNNGRVRVVHLSIFSGLQGFRSQFQIKYGSGSAPCSIFTSLFGSGYEFLDPWRPSWGWGIMESSHEPRLSSLRLQNCNHYWLHLIICVWCGLSLK